MQNLYGQSRPAWLFHQVLEGSIFALIPVYPAILWAFVYWIYHPFHAGYRCETSIGNQCYPWGSPYGISMGGCHCSFRGSAVLLTLSHHFSTYLLLDFSWLDIPGRKSTRKYENRSQNPW